MVMARLSSSLRPSENYQADFCISKSLTKLWTICFGKPFYCSSNNSNGILKKVLPFSHDGNNKFTSFVRLENITGIALKYQTYQSPAYLEVDLKTFPINIWLDATPWASLTIRVVTLICFGKFLEITVLIAKICNFDSE